MERVAELIERALVRGRLAAKYYLDAGRSLYFLSACAVLQLVCNVARNPNRVLAARDRCCKQEKPMSTYNVARASFRLVVLVILGAGAWLLGQGLVEGRAVSNSRTSYDSLPFTDVLPSDWCYPYVLDLWSNRLISGYPDRTFRPGVTVSRGQFTKMLVLATGIPMSPPQQATFEDVPPGSAFFNYAEAGAAAGFATGYDCGSEGEPCDSAGHRYFRPGANVNRGQVAKMIAGALGWEPYASPQPIFADVLQSNPFYGYVNAVARQGAITGYACGSPGEPCNNALTYFRPFGSATRAQVSKIISGARLRRIPSQTPTATRTSNPLLTPTPPVTVTGNPSATPTAPGPARTPTTAPPATSPIATATGSATPTPSATRSRTGTPRPSLTPTEPLASPTQPTASPTYPPASPTSPASTPTWTVIPGGSGITANDPIPCALWPADNIWNRRIDSLPTQVASDAFVTSIGSADYLSNGFGSRMWQNQSIGSPYNVVPTAQAMVPITFTDYPDMSERGPYPFPTYTFVQGATYLTPVPADGDRHSSVLRAGSCALYETWHSHPLSDGSWTAANGAVFNLLSNQLRPAGWTSADAAGFAILPALVRYDEIASGQLTHAVRFTAPSISIRDSYVWPARHSDGGTSSPSAPLMGTRFRLKASVNISGYPPRLRTILQGLKLYGMFLADGGDPWMIGGAPDQRWDDDELQLLHGIHGSDFEAVDESGLMIDPNSGQSR